MRISDWSSDVCSSDLAAAALRFLVKRRGLGRVGGLGLAERQEQQAEEGDQSKHGGVPFVVRFEVRGARISTPPRRGGSGPGGWRTRSTRSEEHTSELQSLMRISYAVFCLKKKKTKDKQDLNREQDTDIQTPRLHTLAQDKL